MQVKDRKIRKFSIKEVEPLINSLNAIYGSEKDICKRLGYNEGYISQLRSREESEKGPQVSMKFYNQLRSLQNANIQNDEAVPVSAKNEPSPTNLNELREYMLGMWADILAGRMATLRSLERLEGKNKGELTADADILAVQIQDRLVRMRRGIEGIGDSLGS